MMSPSGPTRFRIVGGISGGKTDLQISVLILKLSKTLGLIN
jgi:hypothetical protein